MCPVDAKSAERSSEPPQSALGTELTKSSDGQSAILSVLTTIVRQLDTIIEQQEEMISLLVAEDQGEDGDEPSHYMNGQRVS